MRRNRLGAITAFWIYGLAAMPAVAHARVFETEVAGADGKGCRAYLHVPEVLVGHPSYRDSHLQQNASDLGNNSASEGLALPLVLSQQGTGIYSTRRSVEPVLRSFLTSRRVAVLTIDKPGISYRADFGGLNVIDEIYNRYTQADLVMCMANALTWSMQTPEVILQPSLFLSGHSEGAQVMARLYDYLIRREPQLAGMVRLLLLSGMPMDDWRAMLDAQLSDRQKRRFWRGFAAKDNGILRRFGGLTFYYLQETFAQEPLRQTFASLADLAAKAKIRVFQGLNDRNTPATKVMALERENTRLRQLGRPALNLKVRYYDAGHSLNHRALRDIAADLGQSLSTSDKTSL